MTTTPHPSDPGTALPPRGAGRNPRPSSRSSRRTWLLAGTVSLVAHAAVLIPVMLAQRPVTPPGPVEPPAPVIVTLLEPPPLPRPEPPPGPAEAPQPPSGPATPTPVAPPALARPAPPAPSPRPGRAPIPPPPRVETITTVAPAPPAPFATLSDAQLAGATMAGAGGGTGGRAGGGAGGGGGGGGNQACDMVRRLQDALRDDPDVRAAVTRAQREVGPGKALLVWNGDWIRNPGEAGEGLAGVRQAIAMEVAFAPEACRARPMRGLVLISFGETAGGARLVLGKGAWRWSDMLRGRQA